MAFIAIGFGSAAFHATLRRPMQAMDEMPMVLANLVFVFCLHRPRADRASSLARALGTAGVVLVIIYVVFEAYAVFLTAYGGVVVYLAAISWSLAFRSPAALPGNAPVLRWLWKCGFGTYGLGFVLWVADHAVCAHLGVGHLHIAWHGLACMGTVVFVLLLLALTLDDGGEQATVRWCRVAGLPILPYLAVAAEGDPASGDGSGDKKLS